MYLQYSPLKIKMVSFSGLNDREKNVSVLCHFISNILVKNVDLNGHHTHNLKTLNTPKIKPCNIMNYTHCQQYIFLVIPKTK